MKAFIQRVTGRLAVAVSRCCQEPTDVTPEPSPHLGNGAEDSRRSSFAACPTQQTPCGVPGATAPSCPPCSESDNDATFASTPLQSVKTERPKPLAGHPVVNFTSPSPSSKAVAPDDQSTDAHGIPQQAKTTSHEARATVTRATTRATVPRLNLQAIKEINANDPAQSETLQGGTTEPRPTQASRPTSYASPCSHEQATAVTSQAVAAASPSGTPPNANPVSPRDPPQAATGASVTGVSFGDASTGATVAAPQATASPLDTTHSTAAQQAAGGDMSCAKSAGDMSCAKPPRRASPRSESQAATTAAGNAQAASAANASGPAQAAAAAAAPGVTQAATTAITVSGTPQAATKASAAGPLQRTATGSPCGTPRSAAEPSPRDTPRRAGRGGKATKRTPTKAAQEGGLAVPPYQHEFEKTNGPAPFTTGAQWPLPKGVNTPHEMGRLVLAKTRVSAATMDAYDHVTPDYYDAETWQAPTREGLIAKCSMAAEFSALLAIVPEHVRVRCVLAAAERIRRTGGVQKIDPLMVEREFDYLCAAGCSGAWDAPGELYALPAIGSSLLFCGRPCAERFLASLPVTHRIWACCPRGNGNKMMFARFSAQGDASTGPVTTPRPKAPTSQASFAPTPTPSPLRPSAPADGSPANFTTPTKPATNRSTVTTPTSTKTPGNPATPTEPFLSTATTPSTTKGTGDARAAAAEGTPAQGTPAKGAVVTFGPRTHEQLAALSLFAQRAYEIEEERLKSLKQGKRVSPLLPFLHRLRVVAFKQVCKALHGLNDLPEQTRKAFVVYFEAQFRLTSFQRVGSNMCITEFQVAIPKQYRGVGRVWEVLWYLTQDIVFYTLSKPAVFAVIREFLREGCHAHAVLDAVTRVCATCGAQCSEPSPVELCSGCMSVSLCANPACRDAHAAGDKCVLLQWVRNRGSKRLLKNILPTVQRPEPTPAALTKIAEYKALAAANPMLAALGEATLPKKDPTSRHVLAQIDMLFCAAVLLEPEELKGLCEKVKPSV